MSKPRKHTLLLVFIHGFKGTDHTFHRFPSDLGALIAHSLPAINVLAIQYPQYETRGDLNDCVGKLKEWLQNRVIDLEVANHTPSPTVDPSVHVILCGHSMGGIVAAEALLSIARDEVVPSMHTFDQEGQNATNSTTAQDESSRSTPPPKAATSALFFPRIKAVLAFDTPFLGISPGVLAHGAEEQIGHANKAYQAYDQAANFFGWGGKKAAAAEPIANASSRGLPAPGNATTGGGFKWGKLAMYAGAAAGIAGVAGAAYLSWNQINQGLAWAGSHLEFVGCLARGAELQKRVEKVVALTSTHDVGFANFYGALDEKVTSKTKYAGQLLGEDRTFCVVPKPKKNRNASSPVGTKRVSPDDADDYPNEPHAKRKKPTADTAEHEKMEAESEQVRAFADDRSKSKGRWVKCVNSLAQDEISGHQNLFTPNLNPDYHAMVPRARDQILEWIDQEWYERSAKGKDGPSVSGIAEDDIDVDGEEDGERDEDIDLDVDEGAPDSATVQEIPTAAAAAASTPATR
ncbi:Putative alpha/Beta hydrolase [Septoria linicola]|uniref:Alpha/Beta hydrolase n=1 Tax=Septoria linicola TaxID=215465 RepID=A0A9Q9AJ85_9PEZI|nr:putative alpha/Beta hydrolase [Septoria linicola]USW50359.1 Putative alpha/Beta hydrolase [Septoria linicola]